MTHNCIAISCPTGFTGKDFSSEDALCPDCRAHENRMASIGPMGTPPDEQFRSLILADEQLSIFVSSIRMVDAPPGAAWVVGYSFDGYLDCAVMFDGERYFDVQDINLDERLFDAHGPWCTVFPHYPSITDLVAHMSKVHQDPTKETQA